jgi:adenylosuccinate lyase
MNDEQELIALSPLDGRYASQTADLRLYFSEFAFIKYRVRVEVKYLLFLAKWKVVRTLTKEEIHKLLSLTDTFSVADAKEVKKIEHETKHDVKSIEYFLKEKLAGSTCEDLLPFVHFGLTSEDVNNLAYGCMLLGAHKKIMLPAIKKILEEIKTIAAANKMSYTLARTHGQPAVPTTFGKELAVYVARLKKLEQRLTTFQFEGKLNGAVGNYNALAFALPNINWIRFSREFIASFDLHPNLITIQILPADNFIEYSFLLSQANAIFIGLCQDMWTYISRGLVKQKKVSGQVGSSTMPQKINPIDFENAEGNLQIANNYFELFARKLPVSRLQRDLSDSTVKRTIGMALGHTLLAWKSLEKGLSKISFDTEVAFEELNGHYEILAEAMQIYFKMHGDEKGYEKVKHMLMGKRIDKKMYEELTREFPALAKLTPATYIGLVTKLTTLALK